MDISDDVKHFKAKLEEFTKAESKESIVKLQKLAKRVIRECEPDAKRLVTICCEQIDYVSVFCGYIFYNF